MLDPRAGFLAALPKGCSTLFLKQIQKISVAFGLHPGVGDKAQRGAVDAVAHAVGGLRVPAEHMPQVRIPSPASHLSTMHSEAIVRALHYGGGFDGSGKGRPATTAHKFIRRGEQRLTGNHIHVDALFKLIPKFIVKRPFCPSLLSDTVLPGSQLIPNSLRRRFLIVPRIDAQMGVTVQRSRYKEAETWSENPNIAPQKKMFRTLYSRDL